MEIIKRIKARKKRRFILAAAQWGGGEEVHENPNWQVPPTGGIVEVRFSLTNAEIDKWGQRPAWQKSRRVGTDTEFSAKIKDGEVDKYAFSADFLPGFVAILEAVIGH